MGENTAKQQRTPLAEHGGLSLPSVEVKSYNLETRDEEGFIGDRASSRAFREILDDWRERLRDAGDDPLGDTPTEEISRDQLDKLLAHGDSDVAAIIQTAVEEFAKRLSDVLRRFLKLKTWRGTERVAIGGGFRNQRIGELAIGRAEVILKSEGIEIDLQPIRNHPDEAGLIGCAHLAPSWLFAGFDGILAVDIGGSNIRCGAIQLNLKKSPDLSRAKVVDNRIWSHADDEPGRDELIDELVEMIEKSIAKAKRKKLRLAPFIGVGCPGLINADGSIERGAQNLPGKWDKGGFNLPAVLRERLPRIGEHDTAIVMHNDAVVQGLSETPFMQDVGHWGVLTIGTGLGNASFVNRG
jgi:predicted NBD/HSP70 family sugar kinase